MNDHAPLPADVYRAARQGDLSARDRIIDAHMRVVRYHATRAVRRGMPPDLDELISVGVMTVIDKIRTYKPELSAFSTYVGWWIWSAVSRECYLARRTVQSTQKEWRRASKHLQDWPVGSPERERMRLMLAAQQLPERLDAVRADADGADIEPVVASLPAPDGSPFAALQAERNARALHIAIDRLDPRLRTIIMRRMRDPSLSLADIGREMGVSRERVRQLEARAHAALKFALQETLER